MSSELELEVVEQEILQIKGELVKISSQKVNLITSNRLENFVPTPKQLQFFENSDKKRRAGFCGNRFGKTTLGTVEDCSWSIGERLFFPVGHPLRRKGIPRYGIKGLIIGEDWDKVKELFVNDSSLDRPGKFFEFLKPEWIKDTTRMQKGIINSLTISYKLDGIIRESLLVFDTVRSFINNPKSFESSDWDFIHIDEPVPKELWTATSRGLLDRSGYSWWLLTSLCFPWMFEDSVTGMALKPHIYWNFQATSDDNPTLSKDDLDLYFEGVPPDERVARRSGSPLAHGRRVYGFFEDKRHIWQSPEPPKGWKTWTPPYSYTCAYAIDPHPQTPHAVLFMAISPVGDIYFYDEIFEHCLISELAAKITEKISRVRICYSMCDPIAWIENPDTGRCWATTFFDMGLLVVKASKEKTGGIIQTQEIWKPGRSVYVFPKCVNFIREIKSYFFDKENKAIDKDDHMMENLYRLVVHDNLQYYPVVGKSKPLVYANDEFANTKSDLSYMESLNL